MRNKRILTAIVVGSMLFSLAGCAGKETNDAKTDDCYQVATLQSLAKGNYDGYETIEHLLSRGDIGLGTFHELDGEMIVLDGVCYQAVSDGSIVETKPEVTTPFASVKWFQQDIQKELSAYPSIEELKTELNQMIEEMGANSIYIGKVEGVFSNIKVRSELSQKAPYKELAAVLATDQTEFIYDNIEGTLVCVYMPNYMEGVNTPGWHLHFLDKEHKKGGHVLELSMEQGVATLDQADSFVMTMPEDASFQDMNLTDISKEDIEKVETKSN